MFRSLALLGSVGSAAAGTILWDGRFNASSAAEIGAWSWSNEGASPYQYYIHGDGNMTEYVNFDSTYKNPADTGSDLGVKITLDSTAYWEGQTMRRTELIPQTSAAINSGKVYYHFSMQRTDVNPPSEYREHQIAFFESHFTEMKAGWISGESGTSDALLRWNANSATQWNTTFEASVWHNVAYGIDFSAGTVEFYHSTGSDDLTLTVPAVTVSASSNGADWHLGVLELPRDGYTDSDEDLYFSGVYIESGDVTLSVAGPGNVASSSSAASSAVVSSTVASSSVASSAVASSSVAASSSAATTVAAVATSEAVEATSSAVSSAVSSAASSSTKKCTKAASSSAAAYSSSVVAAFASSATASSSSTKNCTKPASSAAAAYSSSVVAAYSNSAVVATSSASKSKCTKPASSVASAYSSSVAAAYSNSAVVATSSASKSKCTKPASSLASAHASSVSAAFSASAAASTVAAAAVVNTSSASANPTTLVTVTTAAAAVTNAENSISSILASATVAATATDVSDSRKKAIDTVVDIVASLEESMAQAYDKANNL